MSARRIVAAFAPLPTFIVLLVLAGVQGVRAEQLVTGVSTDTVSIESNFTGAELVVFGTIERDVHTVSRRAGYDVVLVVRGPKQQLVARRKARLAGIWVNRDSRHYVDAPSYLAMLSNRPVSEIADELALARYQLGLKHLILLEAGSPAGTPEPETDVFDQAVVRLMRERELYIEDPQGVKFLSPALFKAQVRLPANILVGTYVAEVYLFADGAMLGRTDVPIEVRKTGLEQLITWFATSLPLFYGLFAVALAIFSGWFASVIFRRD